MTEGNTARLHYLDAMRSSLMLLGVVLHSARPYDSHAWRVKDEARLELLDGLVTFIHLFRMPAFFVVAGFFAMHLLMRRPAPVFLRERLRRVLIPLFATLFTFNVIQVAVTVGDGGDAGFLAGALLPAWANGSWVSHLWFLSLLAVYFLLAAVSAPLLRALAHPDAVRWGERPWVLALVLMAAVAAPLAAVVLVKLAGPMLSTPVLGLFRPDDLLWYLPCFAVGMLLQAWPGLFARFARVSLPVLGLAAVGAVGMYLTEGREAVAYRAANVLAMALLSWMMVRMVFFLFRIWADRPSRTFQYLSEASYSIYLFHHLTVIATATALLPVALGAGIKFLIVLGVATLVPLAIHHFLIRRSPVLAYLFNGRARGGVRSGVAAPLAPEPGVRRFESG